MGMVTSQIKLYCNTLNIDKQFKNKITMKYYKILTLFLMALIARFGYSQDQIIKNLQKNNNKCYNINGVNTSILNESKIITIGAKDIQHRVGVYADSSSSINVKNGIGWSNLQRGDGGYLAKNVFFTNHDAEALRTVFSLKIDDNRNNIWEKILRIEIVDINQNIVITSMDIERNYFRKSNEFQNFILYTDLKGRENDILEARIWYYGFAGVDVSKIAFVLDNFKSGLPQIINQSESSDNQIEFLVRKAIDGLGFSGKDFAKPNVNDIIYVNKYYMAWIDQTGYYGLMNGLWQLNGDSGNNLNFLTKQLDNNGRVINFIGIAEDGDGKWMGSYMGGEHFEIPSFIRENDDNTNSVENNIANWFSVNQANPNLGTGGLGAIPWWTCCAGSLNNKQSFAQINLPDTIFADSSRFIVDYCAPLTKQVDGDGVYDGDRCNANLLFSNGIRYPVYMKIGYIFYKDKPYLDRTYQIYNPIGNETIPVNTFMAVIQGIILAKTNTKIPWKHDLFKYILSSGSSLQDKILPPLDTTSERIVLKDLSKIFNWEKLDKDVNVDLIVSLGAPNTYYYLSSNKNFDLGSSFYHSFYFDKIKANHDISKADVSICKCVVHGGWEVGSGLLNDQYPILPGESSDVTIRRIGFPQGAPIVDDKHIIH